MGNRWGNSGDSVRLYFSVPFMHWRRKWQPTPVFLSGESQGRGSKYWNFSFNISPSNEYSGLIFLRVDSFNLFAVQGTLKSLLQHHNLKASNLQPSASFMVQLSAPGMPGALLVTWAGPGVEGPGLGAPWPSGADAGAGWAHRLVWPGPPVPPRSLKPHVVQIQDFLMAAP